MNAEAAAKIAAFRLHHPDERLVLIERPLYDALRNEWAERIPAWEIPSPPSWRRRRTPASEEAAA